MEIILSHIFQYYSNAYAIYDIDKKKIIGIWQ